MPSSALIHRFWSCIGGGKDSDMDTPAEAQDFVPATTTDQPIDLVTEVMETENEATIRRAALDQRLDLFAAAANARITARQ